MNILIVETINSKTAILLQEILSGERPHTVRYVEKYPSIADLLVPHRPEVLIIDCEDGEIQRQRIVLFHSLGYTVLVLARNQSLISFAQSISVTVIPVPIDVYHQLFPIIDAFAQRLHIKQSA